MNRFRNVGCRPQTACAVMATVIVCISLLVLGDQALADQDKIIYVSFKLEGNKFKLIGPEKRDAMSERIACQVARKARKKYALLQWRVASPPTEEVSTWAVTLKIETVSLVKKNGSEATGRTGKLFHEGSIPGKPPVRFDLLEIYPVGRPVPFRDPVALELHVSEQLEKQMDTLFEEPIVKDFIGNIRPSENVDADEENQSASAVCPEESP